ncbi:MAG TPA: hypothetical protein VMP89_06150 [Solirubrobacteraceae bacterium]|nr:hypothetical protein [Solirubrobacteraceae bacterium]
MEAQTVAQEPARRTGADSATGDGPGGLWATATRSPFLVSSVVCVALAAISAAVLPTVPSYDPWSWIVWGKEVTDPHLGFFVGGGPSWKPLPVMFTTVFGLFGGASPTLWVIAARAGGLLGLVAAYRLATRLIGAPWWAAAGAGLIAVAGIVLTQDWAYYMFRGTTEPMLIAAWLWAIDRHLDGDRVTAFLLGVATGLMRPEAWPFVFVYALWLWFYEPAFRGPWMRALLIAGLAALPFFWFVPPWISTGQPFLAATHAHDYNGHLGSNRFLEVLRRGVDLQTLGVLILALVATAIAVLRRQVVTIALAVIAAAWWVVVVAETLDGYPGLERFYLPAAAITCVLAGVAVVELAQLAARAVRSAARAPLAQAAAAAAVVVALLAFATTFVTGRISVARAQDSIASHAVTRLDQLSAAVAAVGGHNAAYPCHSSFTAVNHSVQTALAWKLHVTLGRVGTSMRHQGLLFLGPHDSIDGGAPRVDHRLTSRQLIARAGVWRVYRMTTPGSDTRCVGR